MVRASVLVRDLLWLHRVRGVCKLIAITERLLEQHRQRRAPGEASGAYPALVEGRRQVPLRHAASR
jgi:hypothetical protein